MVQIGKLLWPGIIAVMLVVVSPPSADAQLFDDDEIVRLKLTSDFDALFAKRKGDLQYFDAKMEHGKADGTNDVVNLRLRLRGNFRVQSKNCAFPPLRLNFKKKSIQGTIFEGQNILKLVTHCQKKKNYEQFVLLEYLAYRIWNQVTEQSFKVRLAQFSYVDEKSGNEITSRYGFLIEHKNSIAARLNSTPHSVPRTTVAALELDMLAGVSLFQYLIGNTDWAALKGPDPEECCHNIELLLREDGKVLPVPYDFDHAGFVNASYAQPAEELQLRSTRQRAYRGFCATNAELAHWIAEFQEARPAIYALFSDSGSALADRRRKQAVKFLDDFYRTIGSENAVTRQILRKCRG